MDPPLPHVSDAQQVAPNNSLVYLLLTFAQRPGHNRQRRLRWPNIPHTTRQRLHLHLHQPVQRPCRNARGYRSRVHRGRHHRHPRRPVHTSFGAPRDGYFPQWSAGFFKLSYTLSTRRLVSMMSNHLGPPLRQWRRELVNNITATMHRDDWDAVLEHVESAFNSSSTLLPGSPQRRSRGRPTTSPSCVRLSLAVVDPPDIGVHQSLDRDHLVHCDCATDHQLRTYQLASSTPSLFRG